ncbi:phosphate/phosphite/phosphonate ABC transporter substrate-binding protein [Chloroflexota bacterium]
MDKKKAILNLAGMAIICAVMIVMSSCSKDEVKRPLIEEKSRLLFGVSSIESPGNIYKKFKPFVDYLGKKLGMEVILVQKRTYEEINGLFETGNIDFARIAAGAYVKIKEETDVTILALESKNGSPSYKANIIVHRDSLITSFDGLQGKIFAFVDRDSNSGFIYPEFLITQRNTGINSFFPQYIFTGGHDNSIIKVLRKEVDGASVASYILGREANANPEIKDKIRIIQKSPLFFRGPFVARSNIPQDLRGQIRNIMLNMHLDEEGKSVLEAMGLDGFKDGKDADFDSIRDMLDVVGETK